MNTLHKNSATKENIKLLEDSEIRQPLEVDDHDVHINEHIAFMLGGEFERRIKKDSKLIDKILDHIRIHKKYKDITKKIENNGV